MDDQELERAAIEAYMKLVLFQTDVFPTGCRNASGTDVVRL